MLSNVSTRRGFAARLAAILPGLGIAGMVTPTAGAAEDRDTVKKLDYEGKPAKSTGFITPLIVYNGVIYIAGQGAHSRGDNSDAGKQADIETHTRMVMEKVKKLVETGHGSMERILQLIILLTYLHDS